LVLFSLNAHAYTFIPVSLTVTNK